MLSEGRAFNQTRLRLFAAAVFVGLSLSSMYAQEAKQDAKKKKTPSAEVSASDIAAAQQFGATLGIAEWLGPLAPVGLSPFFGITCLSGMAIWGEGWVSADNPLLGQTSPLNNAAVFVTFLLLTLLTSAPRLTKVSKPFAQAVDQLEAWAGIITMVTLKVILSASSTGVEPVAELQLGSMSLTADALLIIAAAINILVINAVKFFFETLIWITPIPAIDAGFEIANKAICGLLMAIYGFSRTAATVLNLIILAVSLIVFRWIYRRQLFFRTMLMDAFWAIISPPKNLSTSEITVFPVDNFGPFAARTRCVFSQTENGWQLKQRRWLRPDVVLALPSNKFRAELERGYFTNSIQLSGDENTVLTFSRYYSRFLPELAAAVGIEPRAATAGAVAATTQLRAELG